MASVPKPSIGAARQDLYRRMEKQNLAPLWEVLHDLIPAQPTTPCKPALWKYAEARPHLMEAWGARFNVQLEESLAIFRYRDQPGRIGRVGTVLGDAGVNIVSAAVGHHGEDERPEEAVMVVTAYGEIPREVVDGIASEDGFLAGRTVTL